MVPEIPEDILHLLCSELSRRRDYASLFSCTIVSKGFAALAAANLYSLLDQPPVNDEEVEGINPAGQQELLVQKWSIMWRSIILSTTGKTILPYHRYLRFLNLRDLDNLLNDSKFPGQIERHFFSGELAKFHLTTRTTTKRGNKYSKLEVSQIVEAVGSTIVPKTRLLERLSGNFSSSSFLEWAPWLPRLQGLELWQGNVLADEGVRQAIYNHSPHFNALSIYSWSSDDCDSQLAAFLSNLPPQSLREFTTISNCKISTETCLALNCHGDSLKELKLLFDYNSIPAMACLQGCTAIEKLSLQIPGSIHLEESQNDVYRGIQTWLSNCKHLREINLHDFKSGPLILTPLLLNDKIRLEDLSLDGGVTGVYSVKDHRNFHLALANQRNLRVLCLKGDAEDVVRDDVDALVESVSQLDQLTKLELRGVSDFFADDAIIRLLSSLENLEEVWLGGYGVSDAVLPVVASLRHLNTIAFNGITNFTLDGLLKFVDMLDTQSNDGLQLSLFNVDSSSALEEDEIALVRSVLQAKVNGRLDYMTLHDPDMSEYEGDDSD